MNKIETIFFGLFITAVIIAVGYTINIYFEEYNTTPGIHWGWYCPNCYNKYHIRQDCVKSCSKCGYKFHLLENELPDSIQNK